MSRKKTESPWNKLRRLIREFEETARADEIKGGGDPEAFEVIEATYKLAEANLMYHIRDMERSLD